MDIGGTKCAASVGKATDGEMSVLCKKEVKTEILPTDTFEKLLPEIERHITKYDVKKIGISCSGPLDVDRGFILNSPNLAGWHGFDIVSRIRERCCMKAFYIDAFLNLFDYYGSDNDLVVENLYYDALDLNNPSFNEQESVSRANSINKLVSLQKGKRIINAIQTSAKQSFKIGQYVTMKVLNDAYFGPSGNPGNNASVVYKMETPGESVLFLGDLGDRGDYYLNDSSFRNEMKSCRVVQMAHHGQRGVTDYFYSMIDDIRVCLYAAPKWVFDNDENGKGVNTSNLDTMHTRDLMRERGVRYSFHAIDKDIRLG